MADGVPDTFAGGFLNFLGNWGFIVPLVGFEEFVRRLADPTGHTLPYWASASLMASGLLISLAPAIWKALRPKPEEPAGTLPDLRTAKPPTFVTLQPRFVPLPEAARRVLEANLGNLLGEAALRASDGDGDNKDMTYQWIGWWMAERMTIYGNRPPSIAPEPITYEEAKRYHMRGGAQQLWATSDRLVYDNLKVRDDELTAAWSRLMFKE